MSRHVPDLPQSRTLQSRRACSGALLSLLAWLALVVSPVAAQAMTRIDTGVPGAVICSASKAGKEGGKSVAPHCQLCTLAQQAVDAPTPVSGASWMVLDAAEPATSAPQIPPARAPPREHPPRAPPSA